MPCSRRWRHPLCLRLGCSCRFSSWQSTRIGSCFTDSPQPVSSSALFTENGSTGSPLFLILLGLAVSIFLPLGPFGQGGYGLLLVGDLLKKLLPQSTSPDSILAEPGIGMVLQAITFVIAFMLWVIGIWFLIPATIALSTSGRPPFGLPYWGLIFPSVSDVKKLYENIFGFANLWINRACIPCSRSNSEPKSIRPSFTSLEPSTLSSYSACSPSFLSRRSNNSGLATYSMHRAWKITHWQPLIQLEGTISSSVTGRLTSTLRQPPLLPQGTSLRRLQLIIRRMRWRGNWNSRQSRGRGGADQRLREALRNRHHFPDIIGIPSPSKRYYLIFLTIVMPNLIVEMRRNTSPRCRRFFRR